jgi:hypothetical protein
MEDDFALRYVRIYPGVNNQAELVTLRATPGIGSLIRVTYPFHKIFEHTIG